MSIRIPKAAFLHSRQEMRRYLAVLLLALSGNCFAAGKVTRYYDYFNTDAFWQRIVLEPGCGLPQFTAGDTCVLIASNRAAGADSLRFMGENRGDGNLRYFIARSGGGKWHIHPCPSLRDGIGTLQAHAARPWVVYTEGMGKIFTSDLDRGMRLAGQYGVNVLLLDYPSIHSGYGAFKNYRFAWNNSTSIYTDYLPVFDSLHAIRPALLENTPLSMFFHSMGNNLVRKIIQKKLLPDSLQRRWVSNVILNAPCVPRRGSRRWIDRLGIGQRVYVHYNPADRVLKLAGLAGFRGILGIGPRKKISKNATYLNFNGIAGTSHSNFLGLYGRPDPPAAAFLHYRILFHGGAIPVNDTDRYVPDAGRSGVYMLR